MHTKFIGYLSQTVSLIASLSFFFDEEERCFHEFITKEDADALLKGQPGFYLIRFGARGDKDGFFYFEVNSGLSLPPSLYKTFNPFQSL